MRKIKRSVLQYVHLLIIPCVSILCLAACGTPAISPMQRFTQIISTLDSGVITHTFPNRNYRPGVGLKLVNRGTSETENRFDLLRYCPQYSKLITTGTTINKLQIAQNEIKEIKFGINASLAINGQLPIPAELESTIALALDNNNSLDVKMEIDPLEAPELDAATLKGAVDYFIDFYDKRSPDYQNVLQEIADTSVVLVAKGILLKSFQYTVQSQLSKAFDAKVQAKIKDLQVSSLTNATIGTEAKFRDSSKSSFTMVVRDPVYVAYKKLTIASDSRDVAREHNKYIKTARLERLNKDYKETFSKTTESKQQNDKKIQSIDSTLKSIDIVQDSLNGSSSGGTRLFSTLPTVPSQPKVKTPPAKKNPPSKPSVLDKTDSIKAIKEKLRIERDLLQMQNEAITTELRRYQEQKQSFDSLQKEIDALVFKPGRINTDDSIKIQEISKLLDIKADTINKILLSTPFKRLVIDSIVFTQVPKIKEYEPPFDFWLEFPDGDTLIIPILASGKERWKFPNGNNAQKIYQDKSIATSQLSLLIKDNNLKPRAFVLPKGKFRFWVPKTLSSLKDEEQRMKFLAATLPSNPIPIYLDIRYSAVQQIVGAEGNVDTYAYNIYYHIEK